MTRRVSLAAVSQSGRAGSFLLVFMSKNPCRSADDRSPSHGTVVGSVGPKRPFRYPFLCRRLKCRVPGSGQALHVYIRPSAASLRNNQRTGHLSRRIHFVPVAGTAAHRPGRSCYYTAARAGYRCLRGAFNARVSRRRSGQGGASPRRRRRDGGACASRPSMLARREDVRPRRRASTPSTRFGPLDGVRRAH